MKINTDEIKLTFKFSDKPEMPATVNILFGAFEVRGFRVMKSKFNENVARFVLYPPSIALRGGRYMDIVRIPDKDVWEEFQRYVLTKFNEEHNKFLFEAFEKKPDDIQF